MGNVLSLKQPNIVTCLLQLDVVLDVEQLCEEITSPSFPTRILDVRWKSGYPLSLYYHETERPANMLRLVSGSHHLQLNFGQNSLEISGSARFFIVRHPEGGKEGDYVQVTYIG